MEDKQDWEKIILIKSELGMQQRQAETSTSTDIDALKLESLEFNSHCFKKRKSTT